MSSRPAVLGALFATTTAVTWGGQFVVGKSALDTVNAFPLSTVRYFVASLLWLAVLWAVEGRRSLLPGGHGLRLFWLGTLGFGGFNLLGFTGLAHARPESASLIVALAPLLTALVIWRRTRVRPDAATFAFMALALAGVALVISAGHPSPHLQRCDRLGRSAGARRRVLLRALRMGAREPAGVLAAPLHGSHRESRLVHARGRDAGRARSPVSCRCPRAQELLDVGTPARVPRASRSVHGGADLERLDQAHRRGEHRRSSGT